jgi:DNA-binding CsgD family transcriptional regulator
MLPLSDGIPARRFPIGQTLGSPPGIPQSPLAPLSHSEIRVLRYLPANLSMPEIANELSVSHNTVYAHAPHLCQARHAPPS